MADKPFDGQATAQISNVGTVEGLIDGEDINLTAQAMFSDAQPGVAKPVTVNYTITDGLNGLASNYAMASDSAALQANITTRNANLNTYPAVPSKSGKPRVHVEASGDSACACGTPSDTQADQQSCTPKNLGNCICPDAVTVSAQKCVSTQ